MNGITEVLKKIIKKENITIYQVAKNIGVDYSSLYKALKPGGNLGAKTIDKILDYLGYEIRPSKSKGRKEVRRK